MQVGDIFQAHANGRFVGNFSLSWIQEKCLGFDEVDGGKHMLLTKNKSYTENDKRISIKILANTYMLTKLTTTT